MSLYVLVLLLLSFEDGKFEVVYITDLPIM